MSVGLLLGPLGASVAAALLAALSGTPGVSWALLWGLGGAGWWSVGGCVLPRRLALRMLLLGSCCCAGGGGACLAGLGLGLVWGLRRAENRVVMQHCSLALFGGRYFCLW